MKKLFAPSNILIPVLLTLNLTHLKAQISITQQHLPSSGDTIRYSNAAPGQFNFRQSGANVKWDFSALEPTSQDVYAYKGSTQTPYLLNFGFSAIGLKIADSLGTGELQLIDVYNFFRKSSTVWNNVGIGFRYSSLPLPQSGKHSDEDEIYRLPLQYLDSSKTTFNVSVPIVVLLLPAGNFYQRGTRETVVDGWGTITTPYASNVNCLRVRSIVEQRDSVAITQPPLNFGFPSTRVEYKWLSTSEKIPLLEVSGTEINGTFTPTLIRYRDIPRVISSPLAPEANFSVDRSNIQTGETVKFSDLSSRNPNQWQWTITPSSGWQFINGTNNNSRNPEVRFNVQGNYSVSLTATNLAGSGSTSKNNLISVQGSPASVMTTEKKMLTVYPSPASDWIDLNCTPELKLIMIYDPTGKLLLMEPLDGSTPSLRVNVQHWTPGIYRIVASDGQSHITQNFIVQN